MKDAKYIFANGDVLVRVEFRDVYNPGSDTHHGLFNFTEGTVAHAGEKTFRINGTRYFQGDTPTMELFGRVFAWARTKKEALERWVAAHERQIEMARAECAHEVNAAEQMLRARTALSQEAGGGQDD